METRSNLHNFSMVKKQVAERGYFLSLSNPTVFYFFFITLIIYLFAYLFFSTSLYYNFNSSKSRGFLHFSHCYYL